MADRNELSEYLSSRGFELVEPTCPECGYGQLVRGPERASGASRICCTAYGQCELAPG